MSRVPDSLPLSTVAIAAALLALAVLAWRVVRKLAVRWGRRRQWRRASAAERHAARLLERVGYRVLGSQVQGSYELLVDGVPTTVSLRADYVVSRGGATYVAEVKSGRRAPLLETASTRRQLLEYLVAFQVRGVLLVDAESGSVREVVFPRAAPRPAHAASLFGLLAFAVATWLVAWMLWPR
jgi:hypothetical protein